MKYLMSSFKIGMVFLILTVENLNSKPLIFQDKNECWVISAKEVITRDKTEPLKFNFRIPIYKGKGDTVEEDDLYKSLDEKFHEESLMQFCAVKSKNKTREELLAEILQFYKDSLLANRDILFADSIDSDGTTAELTFKIREGSAFGRLTFLIPESRLLDRASNDIRKVKIKNTDTPIYFTISIGFRK